MLEWIKGALLLAGLFVGMLVSLEVGRRVRLRRYAELTETGKSGIGAVEGAAFALLGLLLAFTFSGAASRFDSRRELIVHEANNITTAYSRLDLLPSAPRAALQEKLRQYVDGRLKLYRALSDLSKTKDTELARTLQLQAEIWSRAVEEARQLSGPQATTLLLPALNAVFDTGAAHVAATNIHPPGIIFVLLAGSALACSLFAGFGMADGRKRSWLHIVGFAVIICATIYVIVDLEYPRLGLFRVQDFDQLLVDARSRM